MLHRAGTKPTPARLALALAALAPLAVEATAAETWLHPVLPQSVVKAAPAPRRGARPVRTPAPARPFPTALSGDASFVELTSGGSYPDPGSAIAPERIDRTFVRLGGARSMPLTSPKVDGAVTRLEATWAGQGLATLGVLLHAEASTAEAPAFEAFLAEAGERTALAERAKRKETKKAARVVTVASARAFAGVLAPPRAAATSDPAEGRDEPLGLPLELVAGVPPLPIRAGTTLTATLLLDGKPLSGGVVRAFVPWAAAPVALESDASGVVSLPLEGEGRILLAAASVRRTAKADRAKGETWKKADWEVRRTTLELLVLPKAVVPMPAPRGKKPPAKRSPR